MPTLDYFSLGNYRLGGPGVEYATGLSNESGTTMVSTSFAKSFYNGTFYGSLSTLKVTRALGFVPDLIIIYFINNAPSSTYTGGFTRCTFIKSLKSTRGLSYAGGSGTQDCEVDEVVSTDGLYVTANGFRLPIAFTSNEGVMRWEAFKFS